jgi:hypothetical protein
MRRRCTKCINARGGHIGYWFCCYWLSVPKNLKWNLLNVSLCFIIVINKVVKFDFVNFQFWKMLSVVSDYWHWGGYCIALGTSWDMKIESQTHEYSLKGR